MKAHTDAHLVPVDAASVQAITRPDSQLWTLYIIYSVLSNIALPFVILPYYFRYITLRYRFDDHGVSVSHGLIWRRETYLTFARIQDIHVTRNIFERWLGIGTVQIQTASGGSAATESIAGLKAFQDVRNYLYARMRGHRGGPNARSIGGSALPDARSVGVAASPDTHASGGVAGGESHAAIGGGTATRPRHSATDDALAVDALTGIRDELRAVRQLLEARQPGAGKDPSDV